MEKEKHIWCQKFVDSIKDVYRKRKDFVPNKYYFKNDNEVSGDYQNEQSKLKKRKKKKKKKKKTLLYI